MNTIFKLAPIALVATMIAACATPTPAPIPTKAPVAPAPAPTTAPAAPAAATKAPAAMPATIYGAVNAKTGLPDIDPIKVTGNIVSAGSSTVFPLTQRVSEIFKDEGYKGNITIDSIGTGAGFERFCKGEIDISNASARITTAQTDNCKKANIDPIEFRVGTDALAVVMDNESTFLTELTMQQLADVFSGTYKTWDQLNPSYPKEKIQVFSPGTDSGTFDYFTEVVFKKDKKALLNNNPQLSEDDNVLVRGVEGSKYAIGYFGYAYFSAESKRLKAVKINAIEPNKENVDNGKYPLARPLFLYSSKKIMTEKPQVAQFINFYMTRVNDAFKKVAYFPAPEADLTKSKTAWLEAVK